MVCWPASGPPSFGGQVAESIGWPLGNPFQVEVGFANLAIGVAGVMSAWYAGRFWLATIVIVSVYLASAAVIHVVDMVRRSNDAPGTAGFVFGWDLVLPALLVVLDVIQFTRQFAPVSATRSGCRVKTCRT